MKSQPTITWIHTGNNGTPGYALLGGGPFIVLPVTAAGASRQVAEIRPEAIIIEDAALASEALETCERLSRSTSAPIIILSEATDEDAMVRAYAAGAADYVVLPLGREELSARLRALLRRAGIVVTEGEPGRICSGNLELLPGERRAFLDGAELNLTPTEFSLLLALARADGKPVPHSTLIASVWGPEYVTCRHYLRLYVRYLREKIEPDPENPRVLLNEWGVGYFLNARSESTV
jgi:two-component system KDP operon response regulator KdpE